MNTFEKYKIINNLKEVKYPIEEFNSFKFITSTLAKRLKKTKQEFLTDLGFDIKQCAFCDNLAKVELNWEIEKDFYVLKGFDYPRGKYCACKGCVGGKLNPVSKEFLKLSKELTDEEVKTFLSKKGKKSNQTLRDSGWFDDISNNPFSKEFWNKKGLDGNKVVKNKTLKGRKTLKDKGYFEDISNNPFSIDYWVKKGHTQEESQIIVNERNQYRKEYWLKKGFSEKESLEKSKSCYLQDLKFFIDKYGEEEGLKKHQEKFYKIRYSGSLSEIMKTHNITFEEALKFKTKSNFRGSVSKESLKVFEYIKNQLLEFPKIVCVYGNKEFNVYDKLNGRSYFYDFVIEDLKICVEYNGVKFHPKTIDENWTQLYSKLSAKEVYEKDLFKKEFIEKLGFDYFVLWSDDKNNKDKIENIINKIKEKYESFKG